MPEEWEGPDTFLLNKASEHTNAVRYQCQIENRQFDYYCPKALLEIGQREFSEQIEITIMRSDLPYREIGFRGRAIRPRTGPDFWEYDIFNDELANSVRYASEFDGQSYSIYVPRIIFGDLNSPKRLLVYVDAVTL